MKANQTRALVALSALTLVSTAASAQGDEGRRRIRVGLGAQAVPSFPGADDVRILPYGVLSLGREGRQFDFATSDQGLGVSLIKSGGFEVGPVASLRGSRRDKTIGIPLGKVNTTVEAGGFVQYIAGDSFRLRAEARQGVNGHKAFISDISADLIARDGDKYVFSIGPRVRIVDSKFQRTYFGVDAAQSLRTGLPVYRPKGGVQSLGASAGLLYQFTPAVGVSTYARYDRLIDDASRSPIVRGYGSRDQFSGGLALTYTFTMG